MSDAASAVPAPDPDTAGPAAQVPAGTDPSDPLDPSGQSTDTQADNGPAAPAALPAPDINAAGQTTMTATSSAAGPGLQFDGGTDLASYARGTFWVTTRAANVTTEFTVIPAAGSSFMYELLGSGTGYHRMLRLERVPGSDALRAVTQSSIFVCGTLPSGQPTAVTLSLDAVAGTFDVLIGGAPSACTDLLSPVALPITGIRIEDVGNAGYGGHVEFTSVALF
jgi:hypothetical protein